MDNALTKTQYDFLNYSSDEKDILSPSQINRHNRLLRQDLENGNLDSAGKKVEFIEKMIEGQNLDSSLLAESLYYTGIYFKLKDDINLSRKSLEKVIAIKENIRKVDTIYSKALYNLGGLFARSGLYRLHEYYTLRALNVEKLLYGENSKELITTYGSLITAYIELNESKKALNLTDIAYKTALINETEARPSDLAFLYNNIGVLYSSLRDFSKSLIFFEKAEEFYLQSDLIYKEPIINLYRNKSYVLGNLMQKEAAELYFDRGVKLALADYSRSAYLQLNDYAQKLASSGNIKKGNSIMTNLIDRVKKITLVDSLDYFEVLVLYAEFLRQSGIENQEALSCYEKSISFFERHGDQFLKFEAAMGKALLLEESGEIEKSLLTLQSVLFGTKTDDLFSNPDPDLINANNYFLNLLKTKYQILKKQYGKTGDKEMLVAAAGTAEIIISLLDRIRINISEEESRLLLGNRFRDAYVNIIDDYNRLLLLTGDQSYFIKAFEYSEKSKIAGLLASTRELKATEFHIPENLAEIEKELQNEIAILNDRLSGKTYAGDRSAALIRMWKDNLFTVTLRRDSLVKVFEREYPDYYSIKYNTRVLKPEEIPSLIGTQANYLSYVISDSVIFLSIINSDNHKLLSMHADSVFFNNVKAFRKLLTNPDFSNARKDFNEFRKTGHYLYSVLIEPAIPYLTSDRLIISPDNIVSYLPFETIPVNEQPLEKLSYRDLDFLMNSFDISYTYSATFLSENTKRNYRKSSKTIAFSPDYSSDINIQNILQHRQQEGDYLDEIPFAHTETAYVSKLLGGELFDNSAASESAFKSEAGKYDIIHLAMHTILDDRDPMYSTLVFSSDTTGRNDGYLRTYEIYGIPMKARMVVLSSCNTGTGKLYSGEGILSLARGFIYSGSEAVVMSMWEIEDRAGTEIVKLYYNYLKKGFSKSMALRKARTEFLKNADQLRSHPYFWSTLVVYGDNSALFSTSRKYYVAGIILLVLAAAFYGKRRWYS